MHNKIYIVFIFCLSIYEIIFGQNFSYNFDGSGYVTINNNGSGLNEAVEAITIEAWIKPNAIAQENKSGIVSYLNFGGPNIESGFGLLYSENAYRFIVRTTGDEDIGGGLLDSWPGIANTDVPTGAVWTHIAGTYSSEDGVVKIYKNGVLVQTSAETGADPSGSIKWDQLGGANFYLARFQDFNFNGSIDEVRYWRVEKTAEQIQASMNAVVDGESDGLDGYWNFNDNASSTVSDVSGNNNPGTLNPGGSFGDDIFASSGDCFDLEVSQSELGTPFSSIIDFNSLDESDDTWDMSLPGFSFGAADGDGRDYAYKIVLTQPDTIYATTCDSNTTMDLQVAIFSDCGEENLIMWQDDSHTGLYYPDGTVENLEFECTSGIVGNENYANMLPRIELSAGTYYFVVEKYAGENGVVKSWIGKSLIVDSTSLAGDFSSVNYYFNQPVYGGEYSDVYYGNYLGLETSDFTISVDDDPSYAYFESITNLNGLSLSGGENDIKLNIEYNTVPSGGEVANVKPLNERSVYNRYGVPLLNLEGINFDLVDLVPPTVTIEPADNSIILPDAPLTITFSEQIYLVGGGNPDNETIKPFLNLEYTDGPDLGDIDFGATISSSDLVITITPDSNFHELSTIRFTIQANAFQDQGGNIVPLTITNNLVADATPPEVDSISTSISDDNSVIEIYFTEPVYTNPDDDPLVPNDFNINLTTTGNATSAWIATLANAANGNPLQGGEQGVRLGFQYDNLASGEEELSVSPAANQIYDGWGNPLTNIANQNYSLNDLEPPTVERVVPGDNSIIQPDDPLEITFSEQIYLIGGGDPENDNIDDFFNLEYIDSRENILFDATINSSDAFVTITPATDLREVSTIRLTVQANAFQDQNENLLPESISSNLVADVTNPKVDSLSQTISADNSFIDFFFSEPVYTDQDDNPLVPDDFNVSLTTIASSSATEVSIVGLSNAENGNPLQGGEQGVRLNFQYNNPAAGNEQLSVSTASNQIYDGWGLSLVEMVDTTYNLNDVLVPVVEFLPAEDGSFQIHPLNDTTIVIKFDEPIEYANGVAITNDSLEQFISLVYTDSSPFEDIGFSAELNGTETEIIVAPDDTLIELREIRIGFESNIFSDQADPNNIITSAQSQSYTIRDVTPPRFEGAYLEEENAFIRINISEGVYTDVNEFNNGAGAVSASDFTIENFTTGSGTATSMEFINVTDSNGFVPVGGESSFKLFFTLDNLPTGVESFQIEQSANIICDQGGNLLQFDSDPITLYDQVPPAVTIGDNIETEEVGFIYPSDVIQIDYDEGIFVSDGVQPAGSDLEDLIILKYLDGDQENISISVTDLILADESASFNISPASFLQEWRIIQIEVNAGLQDEAGNPALGGQQTYQVEDLTYPVFDNLANELDTNANAFLKVTALEGLYSTPNESGALDTNDFEIINFSSNGGNADTIIINSVTNFSGQSLNGGESGIRLNISCWSLDTEGNLATETVASGVEIFSLRPASGAIYDRTGNIMQQSANTIEFTLIDRLSPTASFVPISGTTVLPTDTFRISFTEPIRLLNNDNSITVADLKNLINMNYVSPLDTIIDFTPSINEALTQIYLKSDLDLLEQASLAISVGSSFEDFNDNTVDPMSASFIVADITPPVFENFNFSSGNRYISIKMTEPVWGKDDAGNLTGLDENDFNPSFIPSGGGANNVTIESVTNPSGILLEGGEDSIHINLNVVGSPTGVETIQIGASSNSIFDQSGNLMQPGQFTERYNLAPAPTIVSTELSLDNSYVQLNFSENVFSSFDNEPISLLDFDLRFENNEGFCDTLLMLSITDTNNLVINSEGDTIRINFSTEAIIASGVESFNLLVYGDEPTIFNESGVYMDPETSIGPINLYDLLVPTYEINIDGQEPVSGDTIPTITFSEPIRNIDNSSIDDNNVDNHFTLYNITDSADVPFNALINEEKNEIMVSPVDTFFSEHIIMLTMDSNFEDLFDNSVEMEDTLIFTIRDYIDPDFDSFILSDDNSTIGVFFNDQIFSSNDQTGAPEIDDFNIEFFSNNGNTTTADIILIQALNGTSLIGGETGIKFIMEYDASPGGQEYILIGPSSGNSLYDESGNSMSVFSTSGRIYLNDELIPTVDSIDVWQGDYLAITEQNDIKLEFSEPLKQFDAELTSRKDPSGFSYTVDSTFFPDSLTYRVNAPMMSLDTIDLIIDRIEDSSGLSTVEISYRFLTPAMGDYSIPPNDTINLLDLNIFVEAWEAGDFTKELGPVIGDYPHFKLSPSAGDGKFDLDDGMVFTRMWYWSLIRFGVSEIPRYLTGVKPDMSFSDNRLIIHPPPGSKAGQIILSYNSQECGLSLKDISPNKSGLFLNSGESIQDKILIEYSSHKEETFPIEFDLTKKDDYETSISLTYSFIDENQNFIGQGDSIFQVSIIPDKIALYQNFPNPFNPTTRIKFDLPAPAKASIYVFDINGRLINTIADRDYDAGTHFVEWNGEDGLNMSVSSGIYFYQIISGPYVKSFKMLLIK